jgi:NhaP-type Na+/H+ or K+/H+ antiporter
LSPEAIVLLGAGAILLVTAVSGSLERVWLTEPLLATFIGLAVGVFVVGGVDMESPLILTILEVTLALILFSDASRIDVTRLRKGYNWPLMMLVVGTPIMIVLGAGLAGLYLELPFGLALLLGVILAPTDAALAEPVLESESVPARMRQTLNIESGLNDGLAVPALLIAVGIIEAETGGGVGDGLLLVISQLGVGVVGGIVVGWLGALFLGRGIEAGWINPLHQRISAVALALVGYSAIQLLGGSGFVGVFIAGGLMSHLMRPQASRLYQFAETEGHSLVLVAFFIFGVGPGARVLERGVPVESLVVAVVSLVVLRPVAIAFSLLGQRLNHRTVAFLGWFGPRGLATIVFVLVATEELGAIDPLIEDTVTVTVMLSILLHGVTAVPMSRWLASMPMAEDMPEMGEAFPHPMRR